MKKLLIILPVISILTLTAFIPHEVGDIATDFKLKSVSGKMVSLSENKELNGAIIVFTCNHCPFSIKYESRLIDLHQKYASKGYPVIAINSNDKDVEPEDSFEKMKERAETKKFPFEYIYDESQEVAHAYGAARTPHVYIVNKEKDKFVIKYVGAIDDNANEPEAVTQRYAEDAVNSLLAGKEVALKNTKAIGCTIKWKK